MGLVLEEEQKRNPDFTWENFPWQIQFLPVYVRFLFDMGKANAVNPGTGVISDMIGASKSRINTYIPKQYRPKSVLVEAENISKEGLIKMVTSRQMQFPLYCKPDRGERAAEVRCVHREEELTNYLDRNVGDFIVEEMIPFTREFCIGLRRKPGQEFRIFSFAERKTPVVVGDGKRTTLELIKALSLTSDQREKLISSHSQRYLDAVLPKDKSEQVVKAASISLGTQLVDLNARVSRKLEKTCGSLLDDFSGFNVGRFDLKADSIADIENGNFKVIELNGLGGAPMHVYTDLSLQQKYQILEDHFSAALEIADIEISNGVKPLGLLRILQYFLTSVRKQRRSPGLKKLECHYLHRVIKKALWLEGVRV